MMPKNLSLRPFIGAKDYDLCRSFYRDLGFNESVIDNSMSVFSVDQLSFYLQRYYAKEWIDNTMLFMEVADVEAYYQYLLSLNLPQKYPGARLSPIKNDSWGRECYLHDPSGVLWHFGQFNNLAI